MSAADEAWQEWLNSPEQEFKANHDRASFMAGAKWALEDAADAWQQGQWSDALSGTQRPDPIQARLAAAQAVTDWLRARAEAHNRPPVDIPDRAAAVAPRETKD